VVVGSNYSNRILLKKEYPKLFKHKRQGYTVRVQESGQRKTEGRHEEEKKTLLHPTHLSPLRNQ